VRAVRHIFLAGLGAAAIAAAAGAQEAVYFDNPFGNPGPAPTDPFGLTGVDYRIDSTRGRVNDNTQLFHSFSRFDIPADDAATFTGPDSINFIFARVTGQAMSEIDGLLRSEVGDADLFVLNPYGVIFGENASLDLGGSFHVSTADVLRFGNGQNFEARLGGAVPVTIAPVVAFGFLDDGGVPETIRFNGTTRDGFSVPDGETFSAIAGRIEIDGRGPTGGDVPTLGSVGGVIQLAAVPAGTEVPADLAEFGADKLTSTDAEIHITDNAIVEVSGNGPEGGARVVIRGGSFVMESKPLENGDPSGNPSGVVTAIGTGAFPGDPPAVDIEVTGELLADNGTIKSASELPINGGASGDIRIAGGKISLVNGAEVKSDIGAGSHSENGPDIRVEAGDLTVASGSRITSSNSDTRSRNTGSVGDIWIDADSILVTGANSEISTETNGPVDGSTLYVDSATSLGLEDGGKIRYERLAGRSDSGTLDTPSHIEVLANTLSVTGGSEILSSTVTVFDGASVDIGSEAVPVQTVTVTAGAIGSVTTGSVTTGGNGGDVTVHAGQILLSSDPDIPNSTGQISAVTQGPGPGGSLSVYADSIKLIDGGQMSTSTEAGAGAAGHLTAVVTGRLFASGTTTVGATPVSSGLFSRGADEDGGNLTIRADSIELERGADFSTSARGDAKPGDMLLTARAISVTGAADSPTSIAAKSDGGEGEGGNLTIDTDTLAVTAGGEITTSATNSATTSTGGKRNAGNLLITAREILVEGTSEFGNRSGITSRTLQNTTGRAGSVTLQPHAGERLTLRIRDRGRASVESKGLGAAGDLLITGADLIDVSGGGEISATVEDVILEPGEDPQDFVSDISILDTDTLSVWDGTITAETKGSGFGGSIDIAATDVELSDATLTAKTGGTGRGGSIGIVAANVDQSGGEITARSSGTAMDSGDAGGISVRATEALRLRRGSITTEALQAAGGDITLAGGNLAQITDHSKISARAEGAGAAGDIFVLDTETFSLTGDSIITAETSGTGHGGAITFQNVGDVFLSGDSSITTQSTADNGGDAGDIVIVAVGTFQASDSAVTTTAEDAGGGRISIQAGKLVYLLDSRLETTVQAEEPGKDAGDINIPLPPPPKGEPDLPAPDVPEFVVINRSIIRANATATDAGDITIAGDEVLISSDSLIEAHSDLGVSGEIQISSPDADVVSQVTPLPSNFVDASDRLLPPCAARTERTGSFVVESRGAIQPSPDSPLSPTLGRAVGSKAGFPDGGVGQCPVLEEKS
jgi:filamentous hemagglutinin family protein